MTPLVETGLSNAVAAFALAVVAAGAGLVCRRPAVVHALWLLVLLKLVTPPLLRIPVPLPPPATARPAGEAVAEVEEPARPDEGPALAGEEEPEAPPIEEQADAADGGAEDDPVEVGPAGAEPEPAPE